MLLPFPGCSLVGRLRIVLQNLFAFGKRGEGGHVPGEPENSDSAGTTVLGGIMVLSAILAQSLMMVNLP